MRRVRLLAVAAVAVLLTVLGGSAAASPAHVSVGTAPPFLSRDTSRPDIASTYGSGSFGHWAVDKWGLPAFDYTADELADPHAVQPELDGATMAQHQVGNDHIKGMAYNDGYTQLWSQDLLAQWANLYSASSQHYAGGYGYLAVGGKVTSTLYLDHAKDPTFRRTFGIGYYDKSITFAGVSANESTYAPFGNDPVLLDDVILTNHTKAPKNTSWFEYWDVNPYDEPEHHDLGTLAPTYDAATRTLQVGVIPDDARDTAPLSIFSAALDGPTPTWDTSVSAFFGNGSRAVPAEVASNTLSGTIALPSAGTGTGGAAGGDTLFTFRSPVTLAPGQSVTLRYVFGMAHGTQIPRLVGKYRVTADAQAASEKAWADYLPEGEFGSSYAWVSRELEWDGYLLRSATVYEEKSGEHTITQGGDYQYGFGLNLGTRSWPHYELPMVYSDPELAREILLYTTKLQPPGPAADAQLPYGTGPMFERFDLGTSDDLDFWLLNAAAEYGLATRDLAFFHQAVPYYDTPVNATEWQHLKIAFEHMQTYLGPHGDYIAGSTGDWNDFSTEFENLTETTLVTAQLAYAYPQLAELADLYGDKAFAAQLRAAGAQDLASLRAQWTGKGWYTRGYSGTTQVGKGVIFEEPQPWAILAGAPTTAQAEMLVANIHRYLDGVGAPGGPTKIGTALVPGLDDPGVTEHGPAEVTSGLPLQLPSPYGEVPSGSTLQGADEWPGGVWFDPNGWLTWALGTLQGKVPGAVQDAWSEYLRNTLANHATQFPDAWDGTISIDDVCYAYYSKTPDECGNGLSSAIDGEITEQATWMVMDAIDLAGVTAVKDGYDITPHLPMSTFSLRLPQVGVASVPGLVRGYVRPLTSGELVMHVTPPAGSSGRSLQAFADGVHVPSAISHGLVVFTLPTRAARDADWAVTVVGGAPLRGSAATGALAATGADGELPLAAALVVVLALLVARVRRQFT